MDENEFSVVCFDRKQAHMACMEAYRHAQALLDQSENVLVICKPAHEPIGIRQRRFFHGVVLRQIKDQARVDGQRYTATAWKEFFRIEFIPEKWEMQQLPGQKKPVPVRKRASTESLGVKAYSEFIEQVIHYAVTELGVEFNFQPEDRALMRRSKQQEEPDAPV